MWFYSAAAHISLGIGVFYLGWCLFGTNTIEGQRNDALIASAAFLGAVVLHTWVL
jgi:hypothetical protein